MPLEMIVCVCSVNRASALCSMFHSALLRPAEGLFNLLCHRFDTGIDAGAFPGQSQKSSPAILRILGLAQQPAGNKTGGGAAHFHLVH
jgi:hypothetical protein